MDRSLSELERAVEQDPGDVEAARQLEVGLLRAGQREALRARYRFKFVCPLAFEDLEPTGHPERRHCTKCERDVRWVASVEDYVRAANEGACVSVSTAILDQALDGLADDPRQHSAQDSSRPCLVEQHGLLPLPELEVRLTGAALPVVVPELDPPLPISGGPPRPPAEVEPPAPAPAPVPRNVFARLWDRLRGR